MSSLRLYIFFIIISDNILICATNFLVPSLFCLSYEISLLSCIILYDCWSFFVILIIHLYLVGLFQFCFWNIYLQQITRQVVIHFWNVYISLWFQCSLKPIQKKKIVVELLVELYYVNWQKKIFFVFSIFNDDALLKNSVVEKLRFLISIFLFSSI